MSTLTDFIKATGNEFAGVADDGTISDVCGYIDTGAYALNALVSGNIYHGFPSNRITGIGAPPATGKSMFCLAALKNFLQNHDNGLAFIFETEAAVSKADLKNRGIDTRRVGVIPITTVQEFRNQSIKILDNYEKIPLKEREPMIFILDSMGMLSTTKEIDDASSGSESQDMTRARQLKATFRVLTLRLGRANVPLLVTNHVYDSMSGMGPPIPVQGGGKGFVYSCSNILTLTKAKEKMGDEITGVLITATNFKSRLTKENMKVRCQIKYDGGLSRYYFMLELAEAAGIFKKVSTRYELPCGTKLFGKTINENPEKYFTPEILDQINDYVQNKFLYAPHVSQDEEVLDLVDETTYTEDSAVEEGQQ